MKFQQTHEREVSKMLIPELFKCPISLDLFTDPVTLCTGQTYDRPCIEKWISLGNLTCPITMLTLHDLSMVPNHTLTHLIRQWRNQTVSSPYVDHHHGLCLATLKQTLESQESTLKMKLRALNQVKTCSNEGLIRFGFLRVLLELGFRRESSYEVVELALASVVKLLPYSDLGWLDVVKEKSKFESLVVLLKQGTPLIKITLCHLLEASLQSKEMSLLIRNSGDIQGSIIDLLPLINNGNAEISEAGVKFMLALCLNCVDNNHQQVLVKLVQLGVITSLVEYIPRSISKEKFSGPVSAIRTIEVLMEVEGGKEALLKEKNGVKVLVKMVFRVSDHQGSESAIKSLMCLCCVSIEAREEAVRVGVLSQLLLLLQSQCNGRTKAKARLLLKLMRAMWAKDPLGRKHVLH